MFGRVLRCQPHREKHGLVTSSSFAAKKSLDTHPRLGRGLDSGGGGRVDVAVQKPTWRCVHGQGISSKPCFFSFAAHVDRSIAGWVSLSETLQPIWPSLRLPGVSSFLREHPSARSWCGLCPFSFDSGKRTRCLQGDDPKRTHTYVRTACR